MRLIDADALIGKLKHKMQVNREEGGAGYIGTLFPIEQVIEILSETKTVDAVKHGRWLHRGISAKCSACNHVYNCITHDFTLNNYCPNCGAKMGEENNNAIKLKASSQNTRK